jgi:hypothetical protein
MIGAHVDHTVNLYANDLYNYLNKITSAFQFVMRN